MEEKVASTNTRAAELISIAETMFGPMTSPWQYAGVTFRDQCPHLYYAPNEGFVQIALSTRALQDDYQRDFQLAHEVCHLLWPSVEPNSLVKPSITVLNEGISTYFSVSIICNSYGRDRGQKVLQDLAQNAPDYFDAFEKVSDLLNVEESAIKKLREIQPMVNKISKADFQAANLPLSDKQIEALTKVF